MESGKERIEEDEAEQAEAGALTDTNNNSTLSHYASFAGSKLAPSVYGSFLDLFSFYYYYLDFTPHFTAILF